MARALGEEGGWGKRFRKVTLARNKCTKGSLPNHHGVKRRPPDVELADLEKQIQRLRSRVQSLIALFVVFLLVWFGWVKFKDLVRGTPRLHIRGANIQFSIFNDVPYVITHVTATGVSEADIRWAPITPPYAVIDSEGAGIDMTKLTWYDLWGNKAGQPPKEAKFSVLYYEPDRVKSLETAEAP